MSHVVTCADFKCPGCAPDKDALIATLQGENAKLKLEIVGLKNELEELKEAVRDANWELRERD